MSHRITESEVEDFCLEVLESQGYRFVSPEELNRQEPEKVILEDTLRSMISQLNPTIPPQAQEEAMRKLSDIASPDQLGNNEAFHRYLTEGITVEIQKDGETRGEIVNLIDFESPLNNRLEVTNQFTVCAPQRGTIVTKRPDVVLLINGLPLVVIELKNPAHISPLVS